MGEVLVVVVVLAKVDWQTMEQEDHEHPAKIDAQAKELEAPLVS